MSKMDRVNAKAKAIGCKVPESEFFERKHFQEFATGVPLREEFAKLFMGGSPILTYKKAKAILVWIESMEQK